MKTLLIENQEAPSPELLRFARSNESVLGPVTIFTEALDKPQELGPAIAQHDALLLESTFHYKQQLEDLLKAFHQGLFGDKVYTFFVVDILDYLQRWERQHYISFLNGPAFRSRLVELLETGRIRLYDVLPQFTARGEKEFLPVPLPVRYEAGEFRHETVFTKSVPGPSGLLKTPGRGRRP
jgi:hypothetical protein